MGKLWEGIERHLEPKERGWVCQGEPVIPKNMFGHLTFSVFFLIFECPTLGHFHHYEERKGKNGRGGIERKIYWYVDREAFKKKRSKRFEKWGNKNPTKMEKKEIKESRRR